MAIVNISGTINSSFSTSGVVVNAAQAAGDAVFTIDLRPDNPIIEVQDNLDYGVIGWDINDAVAVITLSGPEGLIYENEDYGNPDIVPGTSRYLNKTITLPLDPLTDYANILKGNYTLKISWYNSTLDEYYAFLNTYQYILDPPTIANTTTSGPYSGVLISTDTTEYGANVHQIIREHRIQYPDELAVPPPDVVSSNEEVQVTPIYTNEWTIQISSFVEYRQPDTLRIFWEGEGEFTHCVFGGCIGAMYDAINTMLETYKDAMACNLNDQEAYQKRLVIINTAWHLLNEAYWSGDTAEADAQSYIIQEMVEYTGGGVCGGSTSELVTPCPPWTGGGVGGVYTFSNALVEAAGNVTWGGSLVQATTVNMIGYEVLFSGSDAGNSVSQSMSASGGILQKASDGTTEGRVYVTDSLITLERADLVTPANTRGYEITATGLIEKGDFKAGYVDRQLVAKDYVDLLIGSIQANTFENGLTLAGGVVKLGGEITESTTLDITGDGPFRVYTGTSGPMVILSLGVNEGSHQAYFGHYDVGGWPCLFSASQGNVGMAVNNGIDSQIILSLDVSLGAVFKDNIFDKGIVYDDDYSAQWTDHSLVTKKWVEDTFVPITGSGTFAGLTDTPASYTGFGGYFVRVNTAADALEFVVAAFVPSTGGTFTGQVTIATSTDRPLVLQQIGAGSNPGTPEGGLNIISFQDNDGDEQGYIGVDASGNIVFKSWVTGGGILVDDDLEVNGDLIITGVVDGVDIAAWKTEYDAGKLNWDTAYGWGDHAGLYQPLDADLTSIAALGFTSLSFLKKTAADTWALDTEIYATQDYVDSLALTYVYVPDSMTVTTSDGYTGTVTNVQTLDGTYVQIEEATGDPGFEVRFEYINVVDFNNVFLYLYYSGGAGHSVLVQLFNNNTLGWDTITSFTDQTGFTIIDVPVALADDYISGTDEVTVRLYHDDSGSIAHFIQVDYAAIQLTPQLGGGGGVTDHGGLTGLADDDHPHYALADGSRCTFYASFGAKQSSVDAGALGEFSVDDDYLYICVVAGVAGAAVWKRTAILQSP